MTAGKPIRGDPNKERDGLSKEPTGGNTMGAEEPKTLADIAEVVSMRQRRIAGPDRQAAPGYRTVRNLISMIYLTVGKLMPDITT
jgi:hypothetical protein